MTGLRPIAWLREKPIAHRGLHEGSRGAVENSISAAQAAIAGGYAIECDVQLTRDGEIVVFHDDGLERLTGCSGLVRDLNAAELTTMRLCGATDRIPSLADFLKSIGGRTPLVIELKSKFDGDLRLARRVAELVAVYDGAVVIESFDPHPMAFLRNFGPSLGLTDMPLGMVAQAHYDPADWPELSQAQAQELTHFLHYPATRPDFLSWSVDDLPNAIPFLCRTGLGMPVTVWTVRSSAQAAMARKWADQIVFEGFAPIPEAP